MERFALSQCAHGGRVGHGGDIEAVGDEIFDNRVAQIRLVLDNGKLVPIVFVVDQADGVVTIDPPEGLFDL